MSVSININRHHVGPVTAERHPNVHELVTVTVEDDRTGSHQGVLVVADEAIWQTIADRLAALGIVGKVAEVAAR